MYQKIFCEVTREIELFMYNVGITATPELSCFEEDGGIFERLFAEHITDPQILGLKSISDEVYLRVLGMHAFGAGAYAAAKQKDFEHRVSGFSEEDVAEIFKDFCRNDAYELALAKLNIPMESGNRNMLDRVIVIGIKETKLIVKDKAAEPQNVKAFMKVLFNAGISVYMQRKNR